MKEVKDIVEMYNEFVKPKEVTIDMSDFWKEQHEKEMKDISKFFGCYMISPYKVKHNVTGHQCEFNAYLKEKEVTLILSDSEYNFGELADAKSLEYFTLCITGAWTMLTLEKSGRLTKEAFGAAIELTVNSYNMMNKSHHKLNKDFYKAFEDKIAELDKKFDLNNRN